MVSFVVKRKYLAVIALFSTLMIAGIFYIQTASAGSYCITKDGKQECRKSLIDWNVGEAFKNVIYNYWEPNGTARSKSNVWYDKNHRAGTARGFCNGKACINDFQPRIEDFNLRGPIKDTPGFIYYELTFKVTGDLKKITPDIAYLNEFLNFIRIGADNNYGSYDQNVYNFSNDCHLGDERVPGTERDAIKEIKLADKLYQYQLRFGALVKSYPTTYSDGINCGVIVETKSGLKIQKNFWLRKLALEEFYPNPDGVFSVNEEGKTVVVVNPGTPVKLLWYATTPFTSIGIDGVSIKVPAPTDADPWREIESTNVASGFMYVSPTQTTTYTLRISNPRGTATKQVTVKMGQNTYGEWLAGRRYAKTEQEFWTQRGYTPVEIGALKNNRQISALTQSDARNYARQTAQRTDLIYPDALPPCSYKPAADDDPWTYDPQGGDEKYMLNKFWSPYRCSGEQKTCIDVLPICMGTNGQSEAKPTSFPGCAKPITIFGYPETEYEQTRKNERLWKPLYEKIRVVQCNKGVVDAQIPDPGNLWGSYRQGAGVGDFNELNIPQPSTQSPVVQSPQSSPAQKFTADCLKEVIACYGDNPDPCCKHESKKPVDPPTRKESAGVLICGDGVANDPVKNKDQCDLSKARLDAYGGERSKPDGEGGREYVEPVGGAPTNEEIKGKTHEEIRDEINKLKNKKIDSPKGDRSVAAIGFSGGCDTSFLPDYFSVCYFDSIAAPTDASNTLFQTIEARIKGPLKNGILLDNRWGSGIITPTKKSDNVSAVWRGRILFADGLYVFSTVSDDGVEVSLDGKVIISNWTDHGDTEDRTLPLRLYGGYHNVQVRWYERGGGARLQLKTDFTLP